MYYGSGTVDRISSGQSEDVAFALTRWQNFFCLKWRHGHCLESVTSSKIRLSDSVDRCVFTWRIILPRTATQYDRLLAWYCCLSVCLSVTLCIVTKRYTLRQKCLNKWIGSAPLGTNMIIQLSTPHRPNPIKLPVQKFSKFTYLLNLAFLIT